MIIVMVFLPIFAFTGVELVLLEHYDDWRQWIPLALLAIAHGLWRTVRGRLREFAVLAAMGFRPRDLRAVVRTMKSR